MSKQQQQQQQQHFSQHMNRKFFLISFFYFLLLLKSSYALSSSSCAESSFLNCLTKNGECTNTSSECASQCQYDNDCSTTCCLNGFCLYNSYCDSDSKNLTTIPTVIITVVICAIFLILICCAWKYIWRCIYRMRLKKAFQSQQTTRVIAQIPPNSDNNNNDPGLMNNIQMGQIPSGLHDREQFFDNAILIQQGQVIGRNSEFIGGTNQIPINIVYLPDANNNFESDRRNTSKQMKIVPISIASAAGSNNSKNNPIYSDNQNNNSRVFPSNDINSNL